MKQRTLAASMASSSAQNGPPAATWHEKGNKVSTVEEVEPDEKNSIILATNETSKPTEEFLVVVFFPSPYFLQYGTRGVSFYITYILVFCVHVL